MIRIEDPNCCMEAALGRETGELFQERRGAPKSGFIVFPVRIERIYRFETIVGRFIA